MLVTTLIFDFDHHLSGHPIGEKYSCRARGFHNFQPKVKTSLSCLAYFAEYFIMLCVFSLSAFLETIPGVCKKLLEGAASAAPN